MARYLLSCECGESVPVETGHAGGQVDCICGRTLDVPPLRVLRHLPTEATTSPAAAAKRAGSTWGAGQGIATICLLAAVAFGCAAAWSRWGEPTLPEFNPTTHIGQMNRNIDALTPVQAWQWWVEVYKPLAEVGFAEMKHPYENAIRADIDRRRFFQKVTLILAGVFGAIGLTAAFWPRARTKTRR